MTTAPYWAKPLWMNLKDILRSLWYEETKACVICGAEEGPICSECTAEYFHPELARCQRCGKLIPSLKTSCTDCEQGKGPQALTRVIAWGHYTGAWRDYIQSVKFRSQPRRIEEIGRPLAEWVLDKLPVPDGLVPVPMHVGRYLERGFNQAEVIASLLHWELGIPLLQGLERYKPTLPQTKLVRQERLQNLKGAFRVQPAEAAKFKGKRIWLVDDVTTTGSTLEACAETLLVNGVKEIYGLCLAAGLEKNLVIASV